MVGYTGLFGYTVWFGYTGWLDIHDGLDMILNLNSVLKPNNAVDESIEEEFQTKVLNLSQESINSKNNNPTYIARRQIFTVRGSGCDGC